MMAQRIGSVFLLLCASQTLYAQTRVTLQVTNRNNALVTEVGKEQPFMVTVEVAGSDSATAPSVQTSPSLTMQSAGTSKSIRMENGVTSIKKHYKYLTAAYEKGTYTIGPAVVYVDGNAVASNTTTIKVGDEQVNAPVRDAAFLRTTLSKKSAYVGEKVRFTLRFYHANNDVRIEELEKPAFKECKASQLRGPKEGTETIDGMVYRYHEWHCFVYPEEPGVLRVPAVAGQVSIARQTGGNMHELLSFMDQMMGGGARRKVMYSNALELQVKPLPEAEVSTKAVGRFTGFTSKVDAEKAAEGEGIVYTLELIGEGNFKMITHPPLELPEGLKFYTSNTHFTSLAATASKKDFEYVIQGVEPGTYILPEQSFTYFDVQKKMYKTLKSKPIKITITPGEKGTIEQVFEPRNKDHTPNNDLEDVLHVTKWRFRTPKQIGWLWFLLLACVPVLFALLQRARGFWKKYQEKYAPHYYYKNAFNRALKDVERCKKSGSTRELYGICVELFAARLTLPTSEISESRIERALEHGGMTHEQIAAWRSFFADITAARFGSASDADKNHLCFVLLEWIRKFKGVL